MKRYIQSAMLCVISALVLFSCATPPAEEKTVVDLDKARTEIQAMEDAYAAGEKAGDPNAVVAYYSEDAISYGRNEEPLKGKNAIKDGIAKRLAKDTSGNHSVYKVVDLFGEGDMLVEIGSWTNMNPAGAETNRGHYMSYFQKRNGKYQCVRDMSASSMPVKPVM